MDVIKKKYPILDENGQSATYPTFASQVFFDDGTSINALINNSVGYMVMNRLNLEVLASNWTQLATEEYVYIIPVDNINEYTQCYHIDIDMSNATKDTIADIKTAWSLIDNAETVNGGIKLTAFTEAPSINFSIIVDTQVRISDIPEAEGVGF